MKRLLSKTALITGAALAVVTGTIATAAPASAAAYGGQCGSGYGVVNQFNLPDSRGTVFLTYNSSTGRNCVVTVRTTPGAATLMEAYLRRSSASTWTKDSGNYTTYAGPVYVSAAGACVDWGGTIGTATQFRYGTNCG
ncbi:spore-associated protein A [Streptosporangium sp. NPDC006013]|uniref:spore-associated protein A n=1 Tax=Streptosporangium sp. NPDC006013 TaxID=3155596 RepID=UPI0033A0B605